MGDERITIEVSLRELRAIEASLHNSWTRSEPESSHSTMLWSLLERLREKLNWEHEA